jgi:hypothetical protein
MHAPKSPFGLALPSPKPSVYFARRQRATTTTVQNPFFVAAVVVVVDTAQAPGIGKCVAQEQPTGSSTASRTLGSAQSRLQSLAGWIVSIGGIIAGQIAHLHSIATVLFFARCSSSSTARLGHRERLL